LDRIATAIEKNNNQNITDAIYYLAESVAEMVKAIKQQALANKHKQEATSPTPPPTPKEMSAAEQL